MGDDISKPISTIEHIDWNALLKSDAPEHEFPVPFEPLWRACGYKSKKGALAALTSNLTRDEDFRKLTSKKGTRGRPKISYWLNLWGAEHFALAAGTDEGKAIRSYYIRIRRAHEAARQATVKWEALEGVLSEPATQDTPAASEMRLNLIQIRKLGGIDSLEAILCHARAYEVAIGGPDPLLRRGIARKLRRLKDQLTLPNLNSKEEGRHGRPGA